MNFTDAIKTCFSKFATFEGRARRSEYWWFYLFAFIGSLIPFVGVVVALATIVPLIAAACRRLHDTDRSGWWQLLPVAPALLGALIAAAIGNEMPLYIGAAAAILAAILLIVWLATEGTQGPNRFGPPVK
jgi:uncharacterized membrane protein YhaH (DUF805 family)